MHKEDLLNHPKDISYKYHELNNTFFLASELVSFNPKNNSGKIKWDRYVHKTRMSFNCLSSPFERAISWEFPPVYDLDETLTFKLDFVTERSVRLRFFLENAPKKDDKLMIEGKIPISKEWTLVSENKKVVEYNNKLYSLKIIKNPFKIEIYDNNGELITSTCNIEDNVALDNSYPTPLSYSRDSKNMDISCAAAFRMKYDEKIFGAGESFTRLNKRGQIINLSPYDALGVQSKEMYKPIPFFLSSAGYGIFIHSSSPMTLDFGNRYDEILSLHIDEHYMDLFIFLGNPKEILSSYTSLTGRSPMTPDWSFGLWMSRITYDNEKQIREVANKLREEKIPCDVIHIDTGWFEDDWKCNYKFSESRFDDEDKMIKDLRDMNYRVSLWQLPYISPKNELFDETINKSYAVKDYDGNLPTKDAVIDFSNPKAVAWYQELLSSLFDKGVSCIKVDFGEAAPLEAMYHSKRSGKYEHNLYPLRYNKAAAEITKKKTGENIIWARSTWAGSQRYPIHWGGDAEITDSAMAASLRGGLSLGLCGFTFWSHDLGGFTKKSPANLYLRWLAFGMFTSHSRCHGNPPKEPYEYGKKFTNEFREIVELKYKLFPYIKEEAKKSCKEGYPLIRTLFFECPYDPTAWLIEDEYFFGEKMLVAPLFENASFRKVYLPSGNDWIDYFSKKEYKGGEWYDITAKYICVLVKKGSKIKHAKLSQSLELIDWKDIIEIEY